MSFCPENPPPHLLAMLQMLVSETNKERLLREALTPPQNPDDVVDTLDSREGLAVRLRANKEAEWLAKAEMAAWGKEWDAAHYPQPQKESLNRAKYRVRVLRLAGVIEAIYNTQEGLCAYCRVPLVGSFQVDHIMPRSRGGKTEKDNLCCACPPCNYRKRARTGEEFRTLLANV